jgi:hypothetical protein
MKEAERDHLEIKKSRLDQSRSQQPMEGQLESARQMLVG